MRISTVTMFESSLSSMNRQQSEFMKVGQQIASGRRVVNPSDDPQAASRAVGVSQSIAVTQQYADARVSARNALSQETSVLDSASDSIASAKRLIVQAGNGTLSDADRSSIASELRGIYENLLGQANVTNGNGSYLFGGHKDDAPPFVKGANGVTYEGAAQVRAQQVDSSRQMPVGNSGSEVFASVHSGAGYVAYAERENGDQNLGNVVFTGPTRMDAAAEGYGDTHTIRFVGDGTYIVKNETTGQESVPANYEEGKAIQFAGISITLEGQPEANDSITLEKAPERNNIFNTIENALHVLEEVETDTPSNKAFLQNTLSTVSRELDNSLDNVLTVNASVGARLNELDTLDAVGGNRSLNYEQTMSDLVDLDYAQAISDYTLRQVGLQASQKSFVDIQGMSLFDQL